MDCRISIPALREEGDDSQRSSPRGTCYFYPRPPRGGRLHSLCLLTLSQKISIPALREEGDVIVSVGLILSRISIPALREEGDEPFIVQITASSLFLSPPSARRATPAWLHKPEPCGNFYPRPPRGGRHMDDVTIYAAAKFLSPPSARRATAHCQKGGCLPCNFYPRPPRGGRPEDGRVEEAVLTISIPALREEGDPEPCKVVIYALIFLSPPSARRATQARSGHQVAQDISIPALREEGDNRSDMAQAATIQFLSPPSARRATAKTETKSLFSNKLYNILHEFRRALIYNGSKNYPNHAK